METLEKRRATGVSSTSAGTSSWAYPTTKRQAIQHRDNGVNVSLTRELAGNLVNFLQSMGADNELPEDHRGQVEWLNHFHMQVAVNNPLWPEEMSFEFVYAQFVNAAMYNRVELRGHNIHAFITAFRDWITQSGVEASLREKWLHTHPDHAPKQLQSAVPGETPDEIETNRIIDGLPIEAWPDSVLRGQLQTIQRIFGQLAEIMPSTTGYRKQVLQEAKKRGLV